MSGFNPFFFGNFEDLPDEAKAQIKKQHDMENMARDAARAEFIRMFDTLSLEHVQFLANVFQSCAQEGSTYAAHLAGLLGGSLVWKHKTLDPATSDLTKEGDIRND